MNVLPTQTERQWSPSDFEDWELDYSLLENEWAPRLTPQEWRSVLRVCQRARRAARELGPRGLPDAIAHDREGSAWEVVTAALAVLAAQSAKGLLALGIGEVYGRLDHFARMTTEIATTQPTRRRRSRSHAQSTVPERLPVDAARAVPILELFVRYGRHQLRRVGTEWLTRCPFHNDRRPSLRVQPNKGLWYCDPCGIGGDGLA